MGQEDFNLTVLQVLPALETGGVERGAVDVAAAIVAAGGRAIVASAGGRLEAELARAGATHLKMPVDRKSPRYLWRNVERLAALIRNEKIDIIHARSRAPAWSARAAARRVGIPFVTTFHGVYNFGSPLKKVWNRIMTTGDGVIAISEFVARHVEENYGVPRSRIDVIHRGIDTDRFDANAVSTSRVAALARNWRLPDDAPIVMLPGRLARWKGHRILIEALAGLGRSDVVALLVGSEAGRESYRNELIRDVRGKGLERTVRFVGHCSDMPAAFKLASVVVSASTEPEAFGRVCAEAQAMGRPVIASNHGGARETVVAGATGWLTPPGDATALTNALAEALSLSEEVRMTMAQAATLHIREKFSLASMTRATLAVYARVRRDASLGDA
ncbi:MAG: glycosyltransferase family 4 protein [Rhodospirillaceae bacterium]|nr:glycosyltransferase family 4 protein [Rhodospirillaceae bacterium]